MVTKAWMSAGAALHGANELHRDKGPDAGHCPAAGRDGHAVVQHTEPVSRNPQLTAEESSHGC